MLVGGLMSTDPVLERPGQIHSDDLVGCVHSISVNGRPLNLSNPLKSHNVDPSCGRTRSPCMGNGQNNEVVESSNPCGEGQCFDKWKSYQCACSGLLSINCNEALDPVTLTDGGFVEFKISEKHSRMQLLDGFYHGTTVWGEGNRARWKRFAENNPHREILENLASPGPAKRLSIMFRTVRKEGLILYAATNKDFTSVEVRRY